MSLVLDWAGGRWSCQRPVVAEREPRRMGVSWRVMATASEVKVAMQP
jgi:hypothetical protein